MDESGVLSKEAKQRFFSLGLLKIFDTSTLYESLVLLKTKTEQHLKTEFISRGKPPPRKRFEFKFSSITKTSYKFYFELIDLYFKFPELYFSALIFDKKYPNFNVNKYFPNLWDAHIKYSQVLINHSIKINERITIIADYLGKPNSSPHFFETEIRKLRGVSNVCMIESHASLFIQLVDVLLGCIAFDYRVFREKRRNVDKIKKVVSEFLKSKIDRETLSGNFTKRNPNYFRVYEFRPPKK